MAPLFMLWQCLKFLTDQAQDLKRVEKLNNLFLTYMCGKDPYAEPTDEQQQQAKPVERPVSGGDDGGEKPPSGSASKKKAKRR